MLVASIIPPLAFLGSLGPTEMVLVAIIALLLFGKDLPEVARTWGKHFTEFRRHVNGLKSELNDAIYAEDRPRLQYHPEFHNRDPLPEAIPAETSGDLSATADAVAVDAEAVDRPTISSLPSD